MASQPNISTDTSVNRGAPAGDCRTVVGEESGGASIRARHDAHMTINYGRYEVAMVRGDGALVWDASGRSYVDLFAGFGAPILGHCHPDLVAAVTEQAGRLWHVGNLFHTEPQTLAAERIGRATGWKHGARSFFGHGGADSNEAAIKLSRLYGHKHPGPDGPRFKIISATQSFHGRSFATMRATGNPKVSEGFGPYLPGFVNVAFNSIAAIEEELAKDGDAVAVIVEPIQGEGGANVPDDGYLSALRALCDAKDLLLIMDEVWTGCGRTGRWFAHQHWLDVEAGEHPDVMTLAKGAGGGLPVGVMVASGKVAGLFDHRVMGGVKHATTLGGNLLSMAVTAELFAVIERDGLLGRAAMLGERITDRLRGFGAGCPAVTEVRGRGLFLGIELAKACDGGAVARRCMEDAERPVLINATRGADAAVLRLAPPLTISEELLDAGLDTLEKVLADA